VSEFYADLDKNLVGKNGRILEQVNSMACRKEICFSCFRREVRPFHRSMFFNFDDVEVKEGCESSLAFNQRIINIALSPDGITISIGNKHGSRSFIDACTMQVFQLMSKKRISCIYAVIKVLFSDAGAGKFVRIIC